MSIEQSLNTNSQEKIINNEVVSNENTVEVVSEEDKQAKIEEKNQKEKENNEQIEKVKEDLMKQFESNEFGESRIDNPKILDMIAEIEYSHIEDKEMKEMMINNWKRMVDNQYKEVLQDFEDDGMMGVIYGNAGWDRFQIGEDGKVRLINDNNLKANGGSLKKAKELGMEILGSQSELM